MPSVKLKSFVPGRLRRCRDQMLTHKLTGLIVTDPLDVRYLSGFSGGDSVLVLTADRKILVTDSRYAEQARKQCPSLTIKLRCGSMTDAVAEVLSQLQSAKTAKHRIGIIAEAVTMSQYRTYRKAIGRSLCDCPAIISQLRVCKDSYEVAQIRQAVRVAQQSLKNVLSWIEPGKSELAAAGRLEYEMSRLGSSLPAFSTIVAYGGRTSQPHAQPGAGRLRQGQSLLFDWGATVNGYRSDLTRCFVAGRIRPVFAKAYTQVLEAQLTAIKEIRPGIALSHIDAVAREQLKNVPDAYAHGTGHGIGLEIHENPGVTSNAQGVLLEGMVVTVEPGIYVPGMFGIRIEDDVLVTARGATVLSKLAKNLESVCLWE
jgi:Xaa-Pro aminopeptidase